MADEETRALDEAQSVEGMVEEELAPPTTFATWPPLKGTARGAVPARKKVATEPPELTGDQEALFAKALAAAKAVAPAVGKHVQVQINGNVTPEKDNGNAVTIQISQILPGEASWPAAT